MSRPTLTIATATTRLATTWENTYTSWDDLAARLEQPQRTTETIAEYQQLTKAQQGDAKDVGGFVGGHLKAGRRRKNHVLDRSILTLDIDQPQEGFTQRLAEQFPHTHVCYSTHSHTPEAPRLRLVAPLATAVTAEKYEAIARWIAHQLGITQFDATTFEAHRLMYWPSTPVDGEYYYHRHDSQSLDPQHILDHYTDWQDVTTWPRHPHQQTAVDRGVARQADPLSKPGLIGAFCRTHTITETLTHFLHDIYTPGSHPDRWTYTAGETSNGLVIYDDKFAYSHHGTDPAGGQTCNAFDLVRIHRFGSLDENAAPGTPTNKLPSTKAMLDLITEDTEVKKTLAAERRQQAVDDFTLEETDEAHDTLAEALALKRNGKPEDTLANHIAIIRHDPGLKHIGYNRFASAIEVLPGGRLPWKQTRPGWSDQDVSQLRAYIDQTQGLYAPGKTKDALVTVAAERSFHPVEVFLDQLPEWDGQPRVEQLFVAYLGAADSPLTRQAARKFMVAAIARIYRPGTKFDLMPVLVGGQGIGKSTLLERLGGTWYSDALTITDMRDKTAAEKLQGTWIAEIGELEGFRKVDSETIKSFVTRTDDKYRPAYATSVESHPRQCVMAGTTNAVDGFLRDTTGNRRFLPIQCGGDSALKPWELEEPVRLQLWAEALVCYQAGEALVLEGEAVEQARQAQAEALETDDRAGIVEAFLDQPVPVDWDRRTHQQRLTWLNRNRPEDDFSAGSEEPTRRRTTISNIEIWAECFGQAPTAMTARDSYQIAAILQKIPGWVKAQRRVYVSDYGRQRVYESHVPDPPF